MMPEAWSKEEFLGRLQEIGTGGYHHLHPFHVRMNAGALDKDSIRLWVANRFYYQRNIPLKDAAILANCPLREVRQKWIKRIGGSLNLKLIEQQFHSLVLTLRELGRIERTLFTLEWLQNPELRRRVNELRAAR